MLTLSLDVIRDVSQVIYSIILFTSHCC